MSSNQSSREQKFYLDFQKMLISKSAASTANVLASWALIMSYFEKPEVSKITEWEHLIFVKRHYAPIPNSPFPIPKKR
jgi:hypothetical protein